MKVKSKLIHLLESLDSLITKQAIYYVIPAYLFTVYGSLALVHLEMIDQPMWESIYFTFMQLVLLIFTRALKSPENKYIYAMCLGLFTGRLISQAVFDGFEFWFEIPLVLILTSIGFILKSYAKR